MTTTHEKVDAEKLEQTILSAIKKINGKKENDICRYLPVSTGGYIHHFTMRKMKTENPGELYALINTHILKSERPANVPPKQRAARGSRKRRNQFLFSKFDIERLLQIARQAGDSDMIRKLTPAKDLRSIKRELIASIRHGKVDADLWQSYADAVQNAHAAPHTSAPNGQHHPHSAHHHTHS